MTGYSHGEVINRGFDFLEGPDTDKELAGRMRAAFTSREAFHGTMLHYRKDGKPFWNALNMTPVFDDFGELISFVVVQTDTELPTTGLPAGAAQD